jgi:hypothetical protein
MTRLDPSGFKPLSVSRGEKKGEEERASPGGDFTLPKNRVFLSGPY